MIVSGDRKCVGIAVGAAAVVVAAVAAAAGSSRVVGGAGLGYVVPCLNNNRPNFTIIND